MTEQELAAIKARAERAEKDVDWCSEECRTTQNIRPVLEQDVPALIEEVKFLREALRAARKAMLGA